MPLYLAYIIRIGLFTFLVYMLWPTPETPPPTPQTIEVDLPDAGTIAPPMR